MSETKWTRGPWTFDYDYSYAPPFQIMAKAGPIDVCPAMAHGLSEARLIAAAPDLYDCLQAAVDIIGHPYDPITKLFVSTLAKARGET